MFDLAIGSRCLFLRQLSEQFADALTSPLKFLKFRWSGITLFKEFRLPIYQAAQFDADLLYRYSYFTRQIAGIRWNAMWKAYQGRWRKLANCDSSAAGLADEKIMAKSWLIHGQTGGKNRQRWVS